MQDQTIAEMQCPSGALASTTHPVPAAQSNLDPPPLAENLQVSDS